MWGFALVFVSCVAAQVASQEIKMECHEFHDFPPDNSTSPSTLAALNLELVKSEEGNKINISWAINIDASIGHLTGTRIAISGETPYHCRYYPPLIETDLTGLKQKWFHYLVRVTYGSYTIQAANLPLPLPGSGRPYKSDRIMVPYVRKTTTQVPIVGNITTAQTSTTKSEPKPTPDSVNFTSIAVAIFGGLASLMILSSCYIIYKHCRARFASSLGFTMLPTSSMVPVPILMVYPAEYSAFQQAVVALAEFLQWHGGCSVAVDMWQQGKIAQLGPLRWLAEQAKVADRVLIVCPQPSSQPSNSPPSQRLAEPSIPAATHDLYPLILNMVASHAKSASDLAKFWVVQLGKEQDKRPSNLPLELRACKTFCLMKDMMKLCRSLHGQNKQNSKMISDLIFRPGIEKSTVKLREAVEKLGAHQPGICREVEALKSVVTTI